MMTQLPINNGHAQCVGKSNVDLPANDGWVQDNMSINIDSNQKYDWLFNNSFINDDRFVQSDKNIAGNQLILQEEPKLKKTRFTLDSISSEKTVHPLSTKLKIMKFSHENLTEINHRREELTEREKYKE